MKQFFVWTDGGARGNPGPAGFGVVIAGGAGQTVTELSEYLGETTNNQAEYWAVVTALQKVRELAAGAPATVHVRLDSELVVRQLAGEYKVKHEALKPLFGKVRELILALGGRVQFEHIPRRENARADALANEAMDRGSGR